MSHCHTIRTKNPMLLLKLHTWQATKISPCHTKETKNHKNTKITFVTTDKCHPVCCYTKKTIFYLYVKMLKMLNAMWHWAFWDIYLIFKIRPKARYGQILVKARVLTPQSGSCAMISVRPKQEFSLLAETEYSAAKIHRIFGFGRIFGTFT
jgi:hypothetical protein